MSISPHKGDNGAVLPEDVPVTMPELPAKLIISTAQHFKAIGETTRWRILAIIQQQPATAKQIADKLKVPPGTIGHHLQVLEEAGLAQVVARRLIHGIVAKYYARTARIFIYDFPEEVKGNVSNGLEIISRACDEIAEIPISEEEQSFKEFGFPHIRLSVERAQYYNDRLTALLDDFLSETSASEGDVYSLCIAFFKSPPYLQTSATPLAPETSGEEL